MSATARDLMSPTVAAAHCTLDANVRMAAIIMAQCDCCSLPVYDEAGEAPVGVITDHDIVCRAVAHGRDPERTPVGACMSRPAVCVAAATSVEECIEKLAEYRVRRLVVVDDHGACCGVLSQSDVARFIQAPASTAALAIHAVARA